MPEISFKIFNHWPFSFPSWEKEDLSFMELVKNHAKHPERSMDHVWQLEVLDQNADGTGGGAENCGYHAVRNALMLLELAAEQKPGQLQRMKDYREFLPLYYIWEQKVPKTANGDRDASIATISRIMEEIRLSSPTDPLHFQFKEALNKVEDEQESFTACSIANALLLDHQLYYGVGGDGFSLSAAANLWQIATHPQKSLNHLFIVGLSDLDQLQHWVAVGLHQNEGKRHWILMDSYHNQTRHAKQLIQGLEQLMENKEQFVEEIYRNYVGGYHRPQG